MTAINDIKLYSENAGGSDSLWMVKNKSSNKAIRITVLFINSDVPDRTESFDLEPGEIKTLGYRYSQGGGSTTARVTGARYL